MENIGSLVRKLEQDDLDGTTTISKYVDFNQRENLDKIDAYLNSRHISGETDFQGREKPFFNIVTAATNIWYRATDLDRKNIRIIPTKLSDETTSFLATILLQEWMRKEAFGRFLNDWGLSLSRYGSTILKFVEKERELHSEVMPWANMIVDPVDFDANPKIEKLWLTPAQLLKRNYDKKFVLELIDAVETRETPDGQDKDEKVGYIPIYEIHGELALSFLTEDEKDDNEFVQQMHVISFVESKETDNEYDDYTLISGREKKDPYMITHLIEADGRTQSIGAVEHLFQAQWMQNHSAKTIKDNLDMASKIVFQTSDGNFVGRNALQSIENGDILTYKKGHPLTQLNNRADITASQSNQAQWKQLGNEITGISEAMLGAAPKSGTAWRQTEALLQESHSLFEMMVENKGIYIKKMLTSYIIPFVKKQMDTSEEIMPILEDHQIKFVDSRFIPNEAIKRVNQKIKNAILSGEAFTPEQQEEDIRIETDNLTSMFQSMGNRRPFKPSDVSNKTWKSIMKDLEWDLEYEITGEARDSQVVMDTLTRVLQFIGNKQGVPMTPEEKLVFNKILSQTNAVSPLELSQVEAAPTAPVAPIEGGQQQVGTGQTLAPTQ